MVPSLRFCRFHEGAMLRVAMSLVAVRLLSRKVLSCMRIWILLCAMLGANQGFAQLEIKKLGRVCSEKGAGD